MFERVVVALDGSERAERAIEWVVRSAGGAPGALLLARVVEPARQPRNPVQLVKERLARLVQPPAPTAHKPVGVEDAEAMAEAQRYLDRQALALRLRGLRAETFVRWGQPGAQLARLAEDEGAGLIACGADQAEGERPGYGAGAASILRAATVPVLLVRPPRPRRPDPAARFGGEAPGNPRLRRR